MTLIDGQVAALLLNVTPGAVRLLAFRGELTRLGTQRRRAMYSLHQVEALAARRVVDTESHSCNTSRDGRGLSPNPETTTPTPHGAGV